MGRTPNASVRETERANCVAAIAAKKSQWERRLKTEMDSALASGILLGMQWAIDAIATMPEAE